MTPRAPLLPAVLAVLSLLATLASAPAAIGLPAGWYRSDAIGLALEPLAGFRREEPWLLRVERSGEREIRTLLNEGKETKRWELTPWLERVFTGGSLTEERSYDASGRLAAENSYTAGQLDETARFSYGPAGLSTVETYGPDGELRRRERYELGPGGELRRVRRDSPGSPGSEELALMAAADRLVEERLRGGGRSLVSRYDREGRVSSQETWKGRELLESVEQLYAAGSTGGRLPVSTERTVGGTRTLTLYDAQGRESSRRVSRGGKTLEEWSFRYDGAGHRVLAARVDAHGIEQWSYFYDPDGGLQREEWRSRGQLSKIVRYMEGGRVEELYRAGLPFLVVTYRGGVKVLEEFLEGGQVVRRRHFGEGP
jgi:hypothetical protein